MGHLTGSLSPAYILGRLLKGLDIRTVNLCAPGVRNVKAALELGYTEDSILSLALLAFLYASSVRAALHPHRPALGEEGPAARNRLGVARVHSLR